MKMYSFKEKTKQVKLPYLPVHFLKRKCCWLLIITVMVCFSVSIEAAHKLSSHSTYHRSIILDLASGLGIVAAAWLGFSLCRGRQR